MIHSTKKAPKTHCPKITISKGTPTCEKLSLAAAFRELRLNGNVLQQHLDDKLIACIHATCEWRKKFKSLQIESSTLQVQLIERDKELSTLQYKLKQARKFVDEEQKARKETEHERDELQSQLQTIKNLLLADGGKTINNETLDRIRTLERIGSLRRENRNGSVNGSPAKVRGNKNIHEGVNAQANPVMAPIEESAESLLDASDLSFDDTQGDFLDGSRHPRNEKRSSAGRKRSMVQRNAGKMEQKLLPKATSIKLDFEYLLLSL
jgi:DNA-binding protein H-NS